MKVLKIYLALLSTLLFWSSAFVGIRISLVDYSPGSLALFRFLIASISMAIIYALLPNKQRMSWKDSGKLLFIGLSSIGVYHVCLNYGETTVSAGVASFVIGMMPVTTILLSVIYLKEQINRFVWLGVVVSFVGLLLMIFAEKSEVSMSSGVLLIFVSALMGAVYSVSQKPFLKKYHPVAVTSWVVWGGTIAMIIFSQDLINEFPQASLLSTYSVIYLGIFPAALAYVSWCYVLNHWSASKASMYLYAMPVLSTLMGYICLAETPTFVALIGGLLALLGAIIAGQFQRESI